MRITRWVAVPSLLTGITLCPGVDAQAKPSRPAVQAVANEPDPSVRSLTFVEVEPGVRDEVLDWGGTGKPLVLLAGAGNTAHVFDSFAPRLVAHFHVYGITRRGFGASSVPAAGYGADRLADDDLAVIGALRIAKPIVAGHSMAGQELSSIGARHPDKVSALVYMEATYPYAYQSAGSNLKAAFDCLQQRSLSFLSPPAASDMTNVPSYQAWYFASIGALIPEADLRQTLQLTSDGHVGGPRVKPDTFRAYMAGEQTYTGTKAVPILAVCSESHSYGPLFGLNNPEQARTFAAEETDLLGQEITAFARGNPDAHIVCIPHSNHYIYLSNGEQVAAEIVSFIRGLGM